MGTRINVIMRFEYIMIDLCSYSYCCFVKKKMNKKKILQVNACLSKSVSSVNLNGNFNLG